jgi:hypothetical protein
MKVQARRKLAGMAGKRSEGICAKRSNVVLAKGFKAGSPSLDFEEIKLQWVRVPAFWLPGKLHLVFSN